MRSTAVHVAGASASLEYRNDDPAAVQMVTQQVRGVRPGHRYTLSAAVKAAGLNASAFGGGATICAKWAAPPYYGDYLGSGPAGWSNWTTLQLTFVYPLSGPPMSVAAYVRPLVEGANRTPTGTAYFGNFSLIHNPPPAMRTELLAPAYRGRITGSGPARIVLRAHLHLELGPGGPASITLLASLQRVHGAGAAVLEVRRLGPYPLDEASKGGRSVEERAIDIVFATPPQQMLPGAYVAVVTCLDAANHSIGQPQQHNLSRLADGTPPFAVQLDRMQRTLVAGQPFFPLGFFFGSGEEMTPGGADFWRFQLLSRSAFNTVMPYGESSLINLDAAAALGMKVVSSLKQAYFGLPSGDGMAPDGITSVAAEAPYLRQRIQAARNHSALLAWYINDELDQSFLPQIKRHYQIFCEEDPAHPAWQVLCETGHFRDYLGTFDVIGSDPYPIGKPNRGPWGVRAEINDTVLETDAARPVWEVLQAINWKLYNPAMCASPNSISRCRTPNATEVRSMTWQAITAGANGIFLLGIQRSV